MNDETIMAEERRRLLLERVRTAGRVVAADAAEEFGVSEDSIRRDLRALAAEGLVQRVHGGALPALPTLPFVTRAAELLPGPSTVSDAVAARIAASGGLVIVDNGVTSLRIAESMPTVPGLVIATSSPAVAAAASTRGNAVLMIGGQVSNEIGGSVDAEAVDAVRALRADIAVLGACALHPDQGLTADRAEEVAYKRAILASAGEVIVPAVAAKLGAVARHWVAEAASVTTLVTDLAADSPLAAAFVRSGVEIVHV